jgi:Protein of unknown function (DUF2971)
VALPPLYKYLSVQGAKLTLGNRTFRHAKPSGFNDIEDMTVQSIFADETEVALKKLSAGFTEVILAHLNDPPTCGSPMREKLALIQQAYRTNPRAVEMVKARLVEEGRKPLFDVEHMRGRAEKHIKDINEFMQRWRVLCVTTNKDSERMWSEYAEDHKGIVLRIEPNVAKDSKFQRFQAVIYRDKRPALYDDTMEFIAGGLFGDQGARIRAIMEKIIYAKTLKWQHECEYRLAIPLKQNEEPYNTLSYHPEEISEMYLGFAMDQKDRDAIVAKARTVNPNIAVFQAQRDAKGTIAFDRI